MSEDYTTLFKRYYKERMDATKKYYEDNNLAHDAVIKSTEHPLFFEIDKLWDKRRAELDKPLLEKAKYKIGDTVEFIKRNMWMHNKREIRNEIMIVEHICSKGVITEVTTSGDGSGEILYKFDELTPCCPEINPYCLESQIH